MLVFSPDTRHGALCLTLCDTWRLSVVSRPQDPIEFMAKWLYHQVNTRLYYQSKERLSRALKRVINQERTSFQDRWKRALQMKNLIAIYEVGPGGLHSLHQRYRWCNIAVSPKFRKTSLLLPFNIRIKSSLQLCCNPSWF